MLRTENTEKEKGWATRPGIVDARDAGIDALESIRSMNNSQIDLLLEQLQASAP